MRAIILAAMFALAGCAAAPEVRAPLAIEVDKAVSVPCVEAAPARPVYLTEQLAVDATDIQYGDALAIDWVRSRGYERELEVAVLACVK